MGRQLGYDLTDRAAPLIADAGINIGDGGYISLDVLLYCIKTRRNSPF